MNADEIHVLATTGLDAPFWDGLADGAVRLPRCADCAQWVWPAQPRCPGCTSATLEWHDVRPNGRLYSWTRTWYPFVPARAEDLSATYRQIAEELGEQYWIAYAPSTTARPGFRRVSVHVPTQPGLQARTRSGYYAQAPRAVAVPAHERTSQP